MTPDTWDRLERKLSESPILKAADLPSRIEVDSASREVGLPFAADYVEFLVRYGGAMVGPFPIFGLRPVEVMGDAEWSAIEMTKRYRFQDVPGCDNWVVFSNDHSGNPVGMDAAGVVWIHDRDFGGVSSLANSFEEYIRVYCLGLRP